MQNGILSLNSLTTCKPKPRLTGGPCGIGTQLRRTRSSAIWMMSLTGVQSVAVSFTTSNGDWSRQASAKTARWRLMFINGMWFQDAYNYDFATICNSNAPVATWQGEISFCAYNGGGWRKVLESVHHTATVADWYRN